MADDSANLFSMVFWVARGAPNTGYAEFSASTLAVIIGTVDFTPCVPTSYFDSPAVCFCILESSLYFSSGMRSSRHWGHLFTKDGRKSVGCQMTTCIRLVHLKVKAGRSE